MWKTIWVRHPLKLRSIVLESVILWPGWNRFPDWLSTREVTVEGAKRKLARPVQPKKPLSAHTVQAIAEVSVTSNPLSDVRFFFILLDSLSLKDVAIKGDHMTIYVAKRKND